MPDKSVLGNCVGFYSATAFNMWEATLFSCTSGTGSLTGLLDNNGIVTLRDGTVFFPFSTTCPLIWDFGQAGAENVTTAAVSGGAGFSTTEPPSASITATCANGHGKGAKIKSGTYGLQEAVNYAYAMGGGVVVVDAAWAAYGGVDATITSVATPYTDVTILDTRGTTWQVFQKSGSNYAAVAVTGSALSVTSITTSTTAGIGTNATVGGTLAVTGATTLTGATGMTSFTASTTGAVTGQFTFGPTKMTATAASASTLTANVHAAVNYYVTYAGACAITLGAPTATTDDFKIFTITSTNAYAHVITATGLLNTGSAAVNTATFAAYAGATVTFMAYQGKWNVLYSTGCTFA